MIKPDPLDLPAYRVLQVGDVDGSYIIRVESVLFPTRCVHCGSESIVGFGRRDQRIRDIPLHGKRVCLSIDTRRFLCKSCRKTFYEPLPQIDDRRSMTRRLVGWLERKSLRHPFLQLAEKTGVSDITVRKVFDDYDQRLHDSIRFETPEILGIDTAHLIRQPRAVFTNIPSRFVIEMLPGRDKKTVARYLASLPDPKRIRRVVLDMWPPYLEAVRESLPGATIVMGPIPVVRLADAALDRLRKIVEGTHPPDKKRGLMRSRPVLSKRFSDLADSQKKRLAGWSVAYPVLYKAYWAKERFYDFYGANNKIEALAHYKAWEESLDPELRTPFGSLIKAFRNWQDPILNDFEHRVSNTGPEAVNNLVRAEALMGRGYSFDVLRARILLVPHGAHRTRNRVVRFDGEDIAAEEPPHYGVSSTEEDIGTISKGVDTSALLDLMGKGEI